MRPALLALILTAAPAVAQAPDVSLLERYQATITPAELAGLLYVYADDYMAGRETGEPGQRFAARWLAGEYQQMGVAPRGSGVAPRPYALDPYLQPFVLEQQQLRRLAVTATRGGEAVLASTATPETAAASLFAPVVGNVTDASPARLVYVGYAEALGGLDVAGAYALMLPGTAQDATDQRASFARLAALQARGVRGVIVADAEALRASAEGAFRGGRLALPALPGEAPQARPARFPPTLATTAATASLLLAGTGRTLGDAAPAETGVMLSIDNQRAPVMVPTENVVAVVPGTDLADEFVVVSAHLDHVGVGEPVSGDAVYNGADDDGSGTVSLLEIAEAFQTARNEGHGPRRSVLFLHVTGEEKGLLGSEFYADREPLVPIASTVANLNIDMIGRQDPTYDGRDRPYVYIIGADLISADIDATTARVNREAGLDLDLSKRFNSADDPNQFFRRSDHWNFGKHGVPFIFYFTGTHEDYHQPGDEAYKIDYDRMATIARLVFGTAWEIANADERPAVSGTGFN